MAWLLSGCASFPSSINPVSWWHELQGGKIAEERPPPPGANQPYPNLATVPAKPAEPDRAALANLANALIADRTNAQHLAEAAPMPDPSSPTASPGLFGKGTLPPPPPPGTATASASLPAAEPASAPPAPALGTAPPASPARAPAKEGIAQPPSKAPVGTVESAPLAPPGAAAEPTAAAAPAPAVPVAPPPPPSLPGVATATAASPPSRSSAATPSRPSAPSPTPASAATPVAIPAPHGSANTVTVTFMSGSADLQPSAVDTLKQLASRRGSGIIAVTGYGDAASNDPAAQSAALTLGLARAKAMSAALTSAGVPASAVHVDAEAIGRGGAARLVQ